MGTWIMRISIVIFVGLGIYLLYTSTQLHTEPLPPSLAGQTFFDYEQGQLQLAYQIASAHPQTLSSSWLKLPHKLLQLYQDIEQYSRKQTGELINSQIDFPFPYNWLQTINPIFSLKLKTYVDNTDQSYSDFYINPQNLEWGKEKNQFYFQGLQGRLQQILPTHSLEAKLPELRLEQAQDFILKLIDWQLKLDWQHTQKNLHLNLALSQYTNPDYSLLLEALQIHYKAGKQAARFMFTPAELSAQFKQLQFTQNQAHHQLGNVGLGLVISQHQKTMNYHAALSLDNIRSPQLAKLDLDNASAALAFRLENIDTHALEIIHQVLSDWQEQSLNANLQTLFDMLNRQAQRLAKQGLAFEISPLSIQTQHGDIQLQLTFKIDKNKPFSLQNLQQFRQALSAKINLNIHQKLLTHLLQLYQQTKTKQQHKQKIQQQIAKFVSQKLLTKENQHYHLQAQIDKGQLFVNGREQPFPLY